jgi:hypothetical protein
LRGPGAFQPESRDDLETSFKALGLEARLQLLDPGLPTRIEMAKRHPGR